MIETYATLVLKHRRGYRNDMPGGIFHGLRGAALLAFGTRDKACPGA
jgi:hypothetical protein